MKTAGIVLTVTGALLLLSSAQLAVTKYDLRDTNDLSKLIGVAAFSFGILAIGIMMISRSPKPPAS